MYVCMYDVCMCVHMCVFTCSYVCMYVCVYVYLNFSGFQIACIVQVLMCVNDISSSI